MNYEERLRHEEGYSSALGEAALQLEASTEQKISYLKANLHPSTVAYLEPLNFMLDQPFPYDEYDEHWFDESDEDNPAVPSEEIYVVPFQWMHVVILSIVILSLRDSLILMYG